MTKTPQKKTIEPKYHLNSQNEFVIENFNFAKPFADFFPGIAGKYGIPMWVFFANRGQGIASFGTSDKDRAILEFFPANKTWQFVPNLGFRTFIKIIQNKKINFYEPFHNGFSNLHFAITNSMSISSCDLKIEETNSTLELTTHIEYFTIPNDSYSALCRSVTITNTGKSKAKLEVMDGLPQIVPFGVHNYFLKEMSRTIEAWMTVNNLVNNAPFYKLDVDPADRPEVVHVKEGNFFLSFAEKNGKNIILKPLVDPQCVFGVNTDFSLPREFMSKEHFSFPLKQVTQSKTPCAFSYVSAELAPGQSTTFHSLFGHMINLEMLNASIPRITRPGYIQNKKSENKNLIEDLQSDVETVCGSREFNLYAKQTYLDNIMRGGYPILFKTGKKKTVFYLYSRKHGDLERDYNRFQLQPAFFSQGNGNYRDINQNRRSDIWFNPEIGESNIITFLNLLQMDGFNPLVVKGSTFLLEEKETFSAVLQNLVEEKDIPLISSVLEKPITPGGISLFILDNKIKLKVTQDEFLNLLLSHCRQTESAEHGEGFWTDHWAYNLDLIENYLALYPEKSTQLLFDTRDFTFYDNSKIVVPREKKYLLHEGHPKQLHSVVADKQKEELIRTRKNHPHILRDNYGTGKIYTTTLINKLLCLFANKMASLDPSGSGIEMESDKPNWFDSLNGLPALFGSSTCETFELKRLILFIKKSLSDSKIQDIKVTEEIHTFILELNTILEQCAGTFEYWDRSYAQKESFREKTKLGVSGRENVITSAALSGILDNALAKVNAGLQSAFDSKTKLYHAYFIHEIKEFEPLHAPFIKPLSFQRKPLPLFLESQMHALRLCDTTNDSKALYKAVRSSELFDKKLNMYKVTAPLNSAPFEIGRCRAFTPGWLENESIWLHMEYKYLLEMLKCGLYEEFYADFKQTLIPFIKPEIYGRSTLENSSFLVSSAFPDKKTHGNGYVARLSGSTAEFISIWLFMNIGKHPFTLNNDGALSLTFSPILPSWLFISDSKTNRKDFIYSFKFLGTVTVVYHNPSKSNTFGKKAVKPVKITFTDTNHHPVEINSGTIPAPYAEQIRSRTISRIDIYLSQ